MRDVFIYDAVRTPRGKARDGGGLAALTPHELVRQLTCSLDERCGDTEPDGLVLGCVGQFGSQGGNIALVSKLHSELPDETTALTVNNYCVSGLTAMGLAASKIAVGEWACALGGGVEMMSQAGFLGDCATYYTDTTFPSRTRFIPVALAADRLARAENISRDALDHVALISQERAARAETKKELVKSRIAVRKQVGDIALAAEECIRPQTTTESLAELPAAFSTLAADYRDALAGDDFPAVHTISHAPPICDGAGLALLGAKNINSSPRARIVSFADAGGDPVMSLTAGFAAMEKALSRADLDLSDMGAIEFMEAFGVTIAKFLRDYPVDPNRVNMSGGHLAKGHPLGATGAILASTLLDCLEFANARYGMVVATGASGAGAAMILEKL